jgi:4a-hydroxytetrahydrobiopterin dehydratase
MSQSADHDTPNLASRSCVPCKGGVPPLKGAQIQSLLLAVPGWHVQDEHHLERAFTFPDFALALAFVNRAGAIAEEQGHHPDMSLSWGKVTVTIWTHTIDGLTESDFVLAAKYNEL